MQRSILFAFVPFLLLASSGRGDGLIYRLPADGAWATYTVDQHFDMDVQLKEGAERPIDFDESIESSGTVTGFLTIRSVGREGEGDEAQRWIELDISGQSFGKTPSGEQTDVFLRHIVLKVLIPESKLKVGEDPFAHVSRMIFKDTDHPVQEITKPARRKYELDRFRQWFPAPAAIKERTPGQAPPTDRPSIAALQCEVITFHSEYDGPLSGGESGRWTYSGEHRVWLSDESPFGVAALEFNCTSRDEAGDIVADTTANMQRLVLAEFGTRAKSGIVSEE